MLYFPGTMGSEGAYRNRHRFIQITRKIKRLDDGFSEILILRRSSHPQSFMFISYYNRESSNYNKNERNLYSPGKIQMVPCSLRLGHINEEEEKPSLQK